MSEPVSTSRFNRTRRSPARRQPYVSIAVAFAGLLGCGVSESSQDAGASWDTVTVRLSSGLEVEVLGPSDQLAGIADVTTAAELCERFELAVSVLVDGADGAPTAYAASAVFRAATRPCDDEPDFLCVPHQYFREHVQPGLVGYDVPSEPLGAGYHNHPMGIAFYSPETRDTGSPLFTGVFDSRTAATLAGFLHDGDVEALLHYPNSWREATDTSDYTGPPVWARIVEEPFLGCVDPDLVMPAVMRLFFIDDLNGCGRIFALPFPLNVADATFEDHQWCPAENLGYGVVLFATADDHPGFSTECPRPESASIPYLCYAQ